MAPRDHGGRRAGARCLGRLWWWLSQDTCAGAPPGLTRRRSPLRTVRSSPRRRTTRSELLSADGFQITIVENASGPGMVARRHANRLERPSSVGEYSNDIWVVGAGGSNPSQLTSGPMNDSSPAWSPDGRRLAFIRDEGIYVMNADGSGVRPIARPTEEVGYSTPTWSPGGTEIAFSSWVVNIYRADLWRMSADGSRRSRLTTRPDIDDSPDWSPDGRKSGTRQATAGFGDRPHRRSSRRRHAPGRGPSSLFCGCV